MLDRSTIALVMLFSSTTRLNFAASPTQIVPATLMIQQSFYFRDGDETTDYYTDQSRRRPEMVSLLRQRAQMVSTRFLTIRSRRSCSRRWTHTEWLSLSCWASASSDDRVKPLRRNPTGAAWDWALPFRNCNAAGCTGSPQSCSRQTMER